MASARRWSLSPEGWLLVLATAASALAVGVSVSTLLSAPLWLLALFLLYLFRVSDRPVPPRALGVVSPADGRVSALEIVYDHYLKREAQRIAIAVASLGEYGLRGPIEGRVREYWHEEAAAGAHAPPQPLPTLTATHARSTFWLQTDEQDDVVVSLRYGPLTRPSCHAHVGQRLGQGQRCGLLPFGGTVDVLLPLRARLHVAVGDTVQAGCDVIATLLREQTVVTTERHKETSADV